MSQPASGAPSSCAAAPCSPSTPGTPVLPGHDVLVVDDRIAEVGLDLEVPEGTEEIDARGGIVMPGMVDTHRHMWQTAMRGYGADWTLTQYFVWYYLEHGRKFRPQDVHAGNLVAAIEAIDAGVTTCVDWSHGLQTTQHADAAVDALAAVPGRFVLAYGNIQDAPANWTGDARAPRLPRPAPRRRQSASSSPSTSPATRRSRRSRRSRSPASSACRSPPTPACGARPTTTASASCTSTASWPRRPIYVHAATLSADSYHRIAATGGSVSVSTESEQSAGQGYPPTWALRSHDIPVSLSMDTTVWWSGDLFSAMRTTLGADRSREHLEAHARGETVTHAALRAEHVVDMGDPGRRPRPRARGRPRQRRGGQEGRPRADPQRALAGELPDAAPATATSRSRPSAATSRPCSSTAASSSATTASSASTSPPRGARWRQTVDHLRGELGEDAWREGMNPDVPETKILDNPYTVHRLPLRRRRTAPEPPQGADARDGLRPGTRGGGRRVIPGLVPGLVPGRRPRRRGRTSAAAAGRAAASTPSPRAGRARSRRGRRPAPGGAVMTRRNQSENASVRQITGRRVSL